MIRKEVPYVDPFTLYRGLQRTFGVSFLLESAPGDNRFVESSIVGFEPERIITVRDGLVSIDGDELAAPPMQVIRSLLEEHAVRSGGLSTGGLRYNGGLVGYIGWDFLGWYEDLPSHGPAPLGMPQLQLGLYLDGIVIDHRQGSAMYFSHGEDRSDCLSLAEEHHELLEFRGEVEEQDWDEQGYRDAVGKVQRAICAGEAFQVVLARQLRGSYRGDPLDFYGRLRALNPSPYMYFLDFGPYKVAGSSPETLVSVQGTTVRSHPIAGTVPLGASAAETQRLAAQLRSDPKELAEHAMLVDLARNDLGKVCRFGSVQVTEDKVIERFSHVQHLVSVVEGELAMGKDALDALEATFPAGTLSGAPKLRAVELLHGLEPWGRGGYGGVVGYLALNGNLDTAIAIRTGFFDGLRFQLAAGAGITAGSVPANEWQETTHKLAALEGLLGGSPQDGAYRERLMDRRQAY